MKYFFILFLFLSSCSQFAPSFDPNVNQKMAELKANAMDLKRDCSLNTVTDDVVHQRLILPAMILENMTIYRDEHVATGTAGIWKATSSFEKQIEANAITNKKMSPTYCKDKLDDIVLIINSLMKPYGTL